MSKNIFSKIAGFFSSRTFAGTDKAGNRYFTRKEELDGILKEKRWVVFKTEEDPTSIPVEWICWLNGQRKRAPTPEEMVEMEARREQVKLNVARLKEEEAKKLKEGGFRKGVSIGKVGGPDLQSLMRQFQSSEEGSKAKDKVDEVEKLIKPKETEQEEEVVSDSSTEPTGSGASFKPGTWQPPT